MAKKTVKKVKPASKKAAPKKNVLKKPVKKTAKAKKIIKKAAAVKKTVKKAVKTAVKKTVKAKNAVVKEIKKNAAPVVQTAKNQLLKAEELTRDEIKEITKRLVEMRDDAINRLKEKKEMEMPDTSFGDPIDVATQSLDKELLFEQNDNSQTTIDQIESALRKIDKGIYGRCEYCRAALPKKRIKALPFARYCIVCQSSREGGN